MEDSVHTILTNLLLEAGCTISKPAVDELVKWIYVRDTSIIEMMQKEGDRIKQRSEHTYGLPVEELKK